MIGIQLRKIVLLSLILSISIIPIICTIMEDGEDIGGFTRFSRSRTLLEGDEDGGRGASEDGAKCKQRTCTLHATCRALGLGLGCGSCGPNDYCIEEPEGIY
ncbi:uncharacterized protein MELLADRAFT_124262 [Melampsora larici-populina 98AG31]|uniref:Secreted protein n=1 Tax=Melampsora larici-populina (strain 98AG31 / pathotype 3-4-7) TaxID=747676 RepID=F4RAY0_MELLP|nr:uncharacterized protein MELLADRAFT_124262 [Melampsora larici-populina 98AG31]EGG10553.1 secreted protein [Melampsora larici-populina 98AG31]